MRLSLSRSQTILGVESPFNWTSSFLQGRTIHRRERKRSIRNNRLRKPRASSLLAISRGIDGEHVRANREIESGKVLMRIKPYATTLRYNNIGVVCDHCHEVIDRRDFVSSTSREIYGTELCGTQFDRVYEHIPESIYTQIESDIADWLLDNANSDETAGFQSQYYKTLTDAYLLLKILWRRALEISNPDAERIEVIKTQEECIPTILHTTTKGDPSFKHVLKMAIPPEYDEMEDYRFSGVAEIVHSALPRDKRIPYHQVAAVAAISAYNSLPISKRDANGIAHETGIGLYPASTFFVRSTTPNCDHIFDENNHQIIMSNRLIIKDEPLSINRRPLLAWPETITPADGWDDRFEAIR